MVNDKYREYLSSAAWASKKLHYWASVGIKKCQACGSRRQLKVHHKTYVRFGNENIRDLLGVCQTCHLAIHALSRKMGGKVAEATDKYVYLKKRELQKQRLK